MSLRGLYYFLKYRVFTPYSRKERIKRVRHKYRPLEPANRHTSIYPKRQSKK